MLSFHFPLLVFWWNDSQVVALAQPPQLPHAQLPFFWSLMIFITARASKINTILAIMIVGITLRFSGGKN